MKTKPARLEIVSQCPHCGSPIYGRKAIAEGELPTVRKSCVCLRIQALPAAPPPASGQSVPIPWTVPFGPWTLIASGDGTLHQQFHPDSLGMVWS